MFFFYKYRRHTYIHTNTYLWDSTHTAIDSIIVVARFPSFDREGGENRQPKLIKVYQCRIKIGKHLAFWPALQSDFTIICVLRCRKYRNDSKSVVNYPYVALTLATLAMACYGSECHGFLKYGVLRDHLVS